jgi:very-short-patch-repair endonuclease
MTDAEQRLWIHLRGERIPGFRFRRQVPRGPYVVDFACLKAHLVIEVDGSQHAQAVKHDQRRTAWLESQGFRVLRFWDNDVLLQTEEVLESIYAALKETPSLHSPASGGGEIAQLCIRIRRLGRGPGGRPAV